jgi:hypothetical protein
VAPVSAEILERTIAPATVVRNRRSS